MKSKLFIILIASIFLISFISAQTPEQNREFDLKVPFEVNGSIASTTATCNISIQYPNSTYMKSYDNMTNLLNGEFNITLTSSEMKNVGNHLWTAACCDSDACAIGFGEFEVTRTGRETPDSMPILFGVIVLVIFGTSWFFLFFSLKVAEPGPKIFFMLASFIFLIGSIGLGVAFFDDNNVSESISGLVGNLLFALGMIMIIMFFYIFIRQTLEAINLMRIKQGTAMAVGEYKPMGPF